MLVLKIWYADIGWQTGTYHIVQSDTGCVELVVYLTRKSKQNIMFPIFTYFYCYEVNKENGCKYDDA
jgi:hypothetical protein